MEGRCVSLKLQSRSKPCWTCLVSHLQMLKRKMCLPESWECLRILLDYLWLSSCQIQCCWEVIWSEIHSVPSEPVPSEPGSNLSDFCNAWLFGLPPPPDAILAGPTIWAVAILWRDITLRQVVYKCMGKIIFKESHLVISQPGVSSSEELEALLEQHHLLRYKKFQLQAYHQ